jgi:hypothetical protein
MKMIKYNDGFFKGDKHILVVMDGNSNEVLRGVSWGDDFWSCLDRDLIPTSNVSAYPSGVEDYVMLNDSVLHLTDEERQSAKQAHELCTKLRHPGDHSVLKQSSMVVSLQTIISPRKIFGMAGNSSVHVLLAQTQKMKAPPEPASITEPARSIGQRLHMDLIILKSTSIGKNNFILVAVDEKLTYAVGVPTKTKSAKDIEEATLEIVIEGF